MISPMPLFRSAVSWRAAQVAQAAANRQNTTNAANDSSYAQQLARLNSTALAEAALLESLQRQVTD